ncbi:hypothetical protein FNV43_RR26452 [Rhamnella rubrinervis]|uniref:Uncharacterized protein n=1 Tax=Rhamnella rubrinervis TaxID=2594499 RepID=A0A8K0DPB9_9ROSA|nr:hypothetical protein FNV43_RR26452 [Rhamnella rubrinervis]
MARRVTVSVGKPNHASPQRGNPFRFGIRISRYPRELAVLNKSSAYVKVTEPSGINRWMLGGVGASRWNGGAPTTLTKYYNAKVHPRRSWLETTRRESLRNTRVECGKLGPLGKALPGCGLDGHAPRYNLIIELGPGLFGGRPPRPLNLVRLWPCKAGTTVQADATSLALVLGPAVLVLASSIASSKESLVCVGLFSRAVDGSSGWWSSLGSDSVEEISLVSPSSPSSSLGSGVRQESTIGAAKLESERIEELSSNPRFALGVRGSLSSAAIGGLARRCFFCGGDLSIVAAATESLGWVMIVPPGGPLLFWDGQTYRRNDLSGK